jgi:hypothetical protein
MMVGAACGALALAASGQAQTISQPAGCVAGTACQAGTVAIGGAAIGSNALAVAGNAAVSGTSINGAVQLANTGQLYWSGRAVVQSSADGQFTVLNNAQNQSVTMTVGASNLLTLNGGLTAGGNVSSSLYLTNLANTATFGSSAATDFARIGIPAYTNADPTGAGTANFWNSVLLGVPTLTATNARTYTNASTVYIAGPPIPSTNVTATNLYGLTVASGAASFAGGAIILSSGGSITATGGGIRAGSDTSEFSLGAVTDVHISRRAAASLQLGAADAAVPVAQTLTAQSVVGGTANTAGANFTISGSRGTGTGAGGSLLFQVAPAGSAGSSQNAAVTALTIASDKSASFAAGVTMAGGISASGTIAPSTADTFDLGTSSARFVTAWVNYENTKPKTVAGLVTCVSGNDGMRSFVTDATATTFAGAVAGGGTNHVPVYCDGSGAPTWKIG